MRVKNFGEVVSKVQVHLNEYLEDRGVDTSKLFKCINPDHADRNPSCGTGGGNGTLFHCFGCGCAGDIFKAAHYLEGKPLVGKEFIIENLMYLAEKYGIEVSSTEMTEEEIYELDTYRAYKFASEFIVDSLRTTSYTQAVRERGWSKELCREYGVGCVSSFKDFREHLKKLGFTAMFLDDVDLGRKELFDDDHIIFTVKDEHGRAVGFASRNLNYTEDKQNGAKYVNQRTTGAKCNIYKKGSRLYGMDQLVRKHGKKSDPVYVFEGYSDVLTAAQHGLTSCVALGGTSFSVEQLQLLKDHNFYNIILCLDGDEAGQQRTAALLDTTLGGHKDVRVSIVIVPDSLDPDDFIRIRGIEDFKNLKVWSAFEWRLLQYPEGTDPEVICQGMIPLIVNESSSVAQEKMIKTLAGHTGASQKAILTDVNRLQNSREAEKQRVRQNILDKLVRQLQKNPSEAELAMSEARNSIQEIARRFDEDAFSEDNCVAALDAQKEYEEAKTGEYSGYVLGPDLKTIQDALCGDWKKDVWLCFGGKANTGKTSLLCKMAYEISQRVDANNAVVIYHTIDDTKEQLQPKIICVAEGSRRLTINQVRDPKFHAKGKNAKKIIERRDTGYGVLRNLMKEGRLVIKDANDGSSISYADMLIGYYRAKYPDRNIVYILDNFHKLQDFQGLAGDERVRFKTMSTEMKNLATRHHIAILSTVEYTKLEKGVKPSNNNIGETGQIDYDANFICHLYSDLHEFAEQATHYHIAAPSDGEDPKRMPRIEAIIGKNKISSYKGSLWFDFYPDSSDWVFVDDAIPAQEEEAAKEKKQQFKKNRYGLNPENFGEVHV